jgi:DNA-binding transcriptional ArsR family regulator
MMRRKPKGSPRSYTADAIKAASHPTRQAILKRLQKGGCSTVELEKITGENRYNLYHHLSVLEQVGLVGSRLLGKVKEFFLKKQRKPETAFIQLERDDPEEKEQLDRLLDVVEELLPDEIPHLKKAKRARLILSFPWSNTEE